MSDLPLPVARDWMHPPTLVLAAGDDIFWAVDRLLDAEVLTAVILDGERVAGLFTEKDAIRALSRLLYDENVEEGTVADFMSEEFATCSPGMDFFRVAELFLGCHFPTLPVLQEGRLVGVVERKALLICVEEYRRKLDSSRAQEAEIAGRQAERPRDIAAAQRAAAHTSREQLVRLFSRKTN